MVLCILLPLLFICFGIFCPQDFTAGMYVNKWGYFTGPEFRQFLCSTDQPNSPFSGDRMWLAQPQPSIFPNLINCVQGMCYIPLTGVKFLYTRVSSQRNRRCLYRCVLEAFIELRCCHAGWGIQFHPGWWQVLKDRDHERGAQCVTEWVRFLGWYCGG